MQTRTASGAGRPEFTLQHYVRYDPLGFWQEQHTADRARSSALQPFAGPTPPALADSRRLCVSMRWFVNHRIDSARQCPSFLFATLESRGNRLQIDTEEAHTINTVAFGLSISRLLSA